MKTIVLVLTLTFRKEYWNKYLYSVIYVVHITFLTFWAFCSNHQQCFSTYMGKIIGCFYCVFMAYHDDWGLTWISHSALQCFFCSLTHIPVIISYPSHCITNRMIAFTCGSVTACGCSPSPLWAVIHKKCQSFTEHRHSLEMLISHSSTSLDHKRKLDYLEGKSIEIEKRYDLNPQLGGYATHSDTHFQLWHHQKIIKYRICFSSFNFFF